MTLYGAYSQEKVYYPTQVQDLVRYALIRGVKVIPEIDAPSHAGSILILFPIPIKLI